MLMLIIIIIIINPAFFVDAFYRALNRRAVDTGRM